jgi:hypothetical protein
MVYVFLGYLIFWFAGSVLAAYFLGLNAYEGIGLGTAGGVFLSAFKDMWQFHWRTASPKEKAEQNKEKE